MEPQRVWLLLLLLVLVYCMIGCGKTPESVMEKSKAAVEEPKAVVSEPDVAKKPKTAVEEPEAVVTEPDVAKKPKTAASTREVSGQETKKRDRLVVIDNESDEPIAVELAYFVTGEGEKVRGNGVHWAFKPGNSGILAINGDVLGATKFCYRVIAEEGITPEDEKVWIGRPSSNQDWITIAVAVHNDFSALIDRVE